MTSDTFFANPPRSKNKPLNTWETRVSEDAPLCLTVQSRNSARSGNTWPPTNPLPACWLSAKWWQLRSHFARCNILLHDPQLEFERRKPDRTPKTVCHLLESVWCPCPLLVPLLGFHLNNCSVRISEFGMLLAVTSCTLCTAERSA